MEAQELKMSLLRELIEMGFSKSRATKALQYSGNSTIEDAVNWIVDHEKDTESDEDTSDSVDIEIESPNPSYNSEEINSKVQELRDRARRQKEEEEKKLERQKEKERIQSGKELQKAKQIAEENERKRFLALRKAEKEEERRSREKIRQKLHQDKVERRARLGLSAYSTSLGESSAPLTHVETNSLPLRSANSTKAQLIRECLRSLKRRHMEDDFRVKRAFQTLLIYVRNVANNPHEGKFRKIRLSNPAFQARVGCFKEGIDFLELCGFERAEGGEFLLLPRDKVDMAILKLAGAELHSALTNPFFGLFSRETVGGE